MNILFRLQKSFPITEVVEFKYLLFMAMLSNTSIIEDSEEETKYAVYAGEYEDLFDLFSDWSDDGVKVDVIDKALDDLESEGYLFFDDNNTIYLGEIRGRKYFPFEVKNSLSDEACKLLKKELKRYGKSHLSKVLSRVKAISSQIEEYLDKGIDKMRPSDFTELHSLLYEVYTGGETYTLRSKAERFQTTNMLKAYDRYTVFALIVFGTLNYDEYRSKGLPTMTTVACMKDEVFGKLTKPNKGSKDYMREVNDDSDTF